MIQLINQFPIQASAAFWGAFVFALLGASRIIDAFCSYLRRR